MTPVWAVPPVALVIALIVAGVLARRVARAAGALGEEVRRVEDLRQEAARLRGEIEAMGAAVGARRRP